MTLQPRHQACSHAIEQKGMTAAAVCDLLYHSSGLLGVSGISNDMKALLANDERMRAIYSSTAPVASPKPSIKMRRRDTARSALHAQIMPASGVSSDCSRSSIRPGTFAFRGTADSLCLV
jgi:hypothetical protein